MITKLVGHLSGGKLTELQLKAAIVVSKVLIVGCYTVAVFIGGCVHGANNKEEDILKQEIKAQRTAVSTVAKRSSEAEKVNQNVDRRRADIKTARERLNETIVDKPDCDISPDELQRFNELAQEASR